MSELRHFGIPGMKWGIRKATASSIRKNAIKVKRQQKVDAQIASNKAKKQKLLDDRTDRKWSRKALSLGTKVRAYNHASNKMNGPDGDLFKINHSKKYYGKNLYKDKALKKEYEKQVFDTFANHVTKYMTTNSGVSPSGTKRVVAGYNDKGQVIFKIQEVKKVKHAEDFVAGIDLSFETDELGFISMFVEHNNDEMSQDDISEILETTIEHGDLEAGQTWVNDFLEKQSGK